MSLTIGDQLEAARDRLERGGRAAASAVALDLAQGGVGALGGGGGAGQARVQRLGVELVGVQVEAGVLAGAI